MLDDFYTLNQIAPQGEGKYPWGVYAPDYQGTH